MPSKQAEASSEEAAQVEPQDPIDLEIDLVRRAIAETKVSSDPRYLARPWERSQMILELEDRISALQSQKASRATAESVRQQQADRLRAWDEMGPQRSELAVMWNHVRQQIAELLALAKKVDAEHLLRCDRKALSEAVAPISVLNARAEILDNGAVMLRASDHI